MSGISFKLDSFEGPLDLLLFLISKHKLNIYDVEISLLLDQYMEYMNSLDSEDLDSAGDFLAMAARLVYIKTFSLLPHPEEAQQLKKELEGSLTQYSVCKAAAERLAKMCVYGEVFVRPPEKIPVNKAFAGTMAVQSLIDAYMGMNAKARRMKPLKAEQFRPVISRKVVSLESRIKFVLQKLYGTGVCLMEELYSGVTDKSERVATFLAILELTKSGRIFLNDDNTALRFNREAADEPILTSSEGENTEGDENTAKADTDNADETTEPYEDEGVREFVEPCETIDNVSVEDLSENDFVDKIDKLQADTVQRYLPERRASENKLAVSAFLFIKGNNDNTKMQDTQAVQADEDTKIEADTDNADDTEVCMTGVFVRKNRFLYRDRWYWGYSKDEGNCWQYRRERFR